MLFYLKKQMIFINTHRFTPSFQLSFINSFATNYLINPLMLAILLWIFWLLLTMLDNHS